MYAIYENKGVLDIRALTIMGLNAKPNSSTPIGYFGTGLKYALAVLARKGCDVIIQSGETDRTYKLQAQPSTFRGQEFMQLELVEIDSPLNIIPTLLPFTTQFGRNWEMWMVLREIECNMRDENGSFYTCEQVPMPQEGMIRIIITGNEFLRCVHDQRKDVFYDVGNKVAARQEVDKIWVRPVETQNFYYRGILVYSNMERSFACEYNIEHAMSLTEDRTVKDLYGMYYRIAELFVSLNIAYRQRILQRPDAWEWEAMRNYGMDYFASDEQKATIIEELRAYRKEFGKLPEEAEKWLSEADIRASMAESMALDGHMSDIFNEAIIRLLTAGYPVDEYKIKVVPALPRNVLGLADNTNDTILIAARCFEDGLECVMATMLEEFCHLRHRLYDESREMQDWLLRQTILQIQRRIRDGKRSYVESSS